MNVTNKTVLVTGGGSGVGFQIARLLHEKGNTVIITGKNEQVLKEAVARLPNVDYFAADVTRQNELEDLAAFISFDYCKLDVLVNADAVPCVYRSEAGVSAYEKVKTEIEVSYCSRVRLVEKLLPMLERQPAAVIVNVTPVIDPSLSIRTSTSAVGEAILHAYTRTLRFTMETMPSPVKVFEITLPLVSTGFSAATDDALMVIPAEDVARALFQGLENDTFDLYIDRIAGHTTSFNVCQPYRYLTNPDSGL